MFVTEGRLLLELVHGRRAESPWALGTGLNLTPGQQPAALRIDHLEPDRTQPVANAQHRDIVEDRVLIVGALQVVVGDFCAEMVNVMQADIPLKNWNTFGSFR